jgi:MerR family mercuric resistance operon transcriptional regulator
MRTFTIGRLARAAGVNVETVRYYQRRGLLATPSRPVGGVRHYPEQTLGQLQFIKRAQQLGFTLREIRELLQLGSGHCRDTRRLAEAQLRIIEDRLQDLQRMRRTLRRLITACHEGGDRSCPIIATLSQTQRTK